jgi:signal transduction histidine kinase
MATDSSAPSVLIVEDSATQAEKLRFSLEERRFAVTVASDGIAGLEAVRERKPLLVVSDIVMPGLNGYELCRRVKSDPDLRGTLFILLTSLSNPLDVIEGLECGADGFVVKTGREVPILECIDRLLRTGGEEAPERDGMGLQVRFAGKEFRIDADARRIFDFLMSTYDAAYRTNEELLKARNSLKELNEGLESKVNERTEELAKKNREIAAMYQQLWQAAKLATMGELAASIAHELNNPLQILSFRVESLSMRESRDPAVLKALSVMAMEIERMAALVANLLQLSRQEQGRISTVDIPSELEKTVDLFHHHLRKFDIEVRRDFPPGLPTIRADAQQLQQVFLNLFTNASDAMPSGGTLTLRARGGGGEGPNGKALVVEIADTGTGIAAADLPRVMETFFTTKPSGKGTGLGLPICRRIMEAHGGAISIESAQGIGTTVRLTFPFREEDPPNER